MGHHLQEETPFKQRADHFGRQRSSTEIHLLGVQIYGTLAFTGHINIVTHSSYNQLWRIRKIRRYLTTLVTIQLVRLLILTRVDYCNSLFLGFLAILLTQLQSVLHALARLICGVIWNDHVMPLFKNNLHWLHIPERIIYKCHWLTFWALHDLTCPDYIRELVHSPVPAELSHLSCDEADGLY